MSNSNEKNYSKKNRFILNLYCEIYASYTIALSAGAWLYSLCMSTTSACIESTTNSPDTTTDTTGEPLENVPTIKYQHSEHQNFKSCYKFESSGINGPQIFACYCDRVLSHQYLPMVENFHGAILATWSINFIMDHNTLRSICINKPLHLSLRSCVQIYRRNS